MSRGVVTLRALLAEIGGESELPTEFRLFRAGVNHTTKGDFLFDEAAAVSVMAAYEQQGVDLPIDLDHLMLGDPADTPRTDVGDARGWVKLQLRNGELWAVDVKWTPDGERRLRERTHRYTSPAFLTDDEGRIVELINVALVGMPATHECAPLVAASKAAVPLKVRLSAALLRAATYNPKERTTPR